MDRQPLDLGGVHEAVRGGLQIASGQRATRPNAPESQYSLVTSLAAPRSRPIDENFGAPSAAHVKSPSRSSSDGRTCILAGHVERTSTLVRLAAWTAS